MPGTWALPLKWAPHKAWVFWLFDPGPGGPGAPGRAPGGPAEPSLGLPGASGGLREAPGTKDKPKQKT